MKDMNQILEGCIRHKKSSQNLLYDKYSGLLMGICMRYAGSRSEAEEILQECFMRIFLNIGGFSGKGSVKKRLRKIAVSTAVEFYSEIPEDGESVDTPEYPEQEHGSLSLKEDLFTPAELYKILNELPVKQRIVFNLYAFEGYRHKDIARILSIDTEASRSLYNKSETVIRHKLELPEKENKVDPGKMPDIEII